MDLIMFLKVMMHSFTRGSDGANLPRRLPTSILENNPSVTCDQLFTIST